MKFTSATTIILSTLSIFGATEGAGVRGTARRGVPTRQLDGDGSAPCKDLSQDVHCNHGGAGCTMDDPAFIHDGCASPNFPVFYDQMDQDLTFGSGWYCNDGTDVQDLTCDTAYIHTNCSGDGDLVNFNSGFWLCNN